MIKKQPLLTKIILFLIIIVPVVILSYNSFKYINLNYDKGEYTGYILEIKCSNINEYRLSPKNSKQSYYVKENDYISELLGKNLETDYEATDSIKLLDKNSDFLKTTINGSNRIILIIKQLNELDAVISVRRLNDFEEIYLEYGKSYKFRVQEDSYPYNEISRYTIKLKKAD